VSNPALDQFAILPALQRSHKVDTQTRLCVRTCFYSPNQNEQKFSLAPSLHAATVVACSM